MVVCRQCGKEITAPENVRQHAYQRKDPHIVVREPVIFERLEAIIRYLKSRPGAARAQAAADSPALVVVLCAGASELAAASVPPLPLAGESTTS